MFGPVVCCCLGESLAVPTPGPEASSHCHSEAELPASPTDEHRDGHNGDCDCRGVTLDQAKGAPIGPDGKSVSTLPSPADSVAAIALPLPVASTRVGLVRLGEPPPVSGRERCILHGVLLH